MRYVVMVGEDPDTAAVVTSPLGGVIIYTDHHEACETAKRLVRNGHVPGSFVAKFVATAFFLPVGPPREDTGEHYVDETHLTDEGHIKAPAGDN